MADVETSQTWGSFWKRGGGVLFTAQRKSLPPNHHHHHHHPDERRRRRRRRDGCVGAAARHGNERPQTSRAAPLFFVEKSEKRRGEKLDSYVRQGFFVVVRLFRSRRRTDEKKAILLIAFKVKRVDRKRFHCSACFLTHIFQEMRRHLCSHESSKVKTT